MATYDFSVFAGHNKSKNGVYDPGACYNGMEEAYFTKIIAAEVYNLLKDKFSVQYGENNYEDNLLTGHTIKGKFAVSIHLNASNGQGKGAECYVPLGESYFVIEQEILNGLAQLGLTNRGVKSRDYHTEAYSQRYGGIKSSGLDYYREIRQAWEKGISLTIIEVGFIDSNDINIIKANISKIAFIIASAIAKEYGKVLTPVEEEKPPINDSGANDKDTLFRVCVGSFADKNNAVIRMNELKKLGYTDTFIATYKK